MRISRSEARALLGGLPFEAKKNGEPRKARPLTLSKQVLSPAQSHPETQHQIIFVDWRDRWKRLHPDLGRTFHCANEFHGTDRVKKRNKKTGQEYWYSAAASKRKAMGVTAGVFDLMNLTRRRDFSGLAVELKVLDNELIDNPSAEWDQRRERAFLAEQGWSNHVAWCWSEAALLHLWYFSITDRSVIASAGSPRDYIVPQWGGHDERCGCPLNLRQIFSLKE